jgi:hypothetical protein
MEQLQTEYLRSAFDYYIAARFATITDTPCWQSCSLFVTVVLSSRPTAARPPEENKEAVVGNISTFGDYGSITLEIIGSSFPN